MKTLKSEPTIVYNQREAYIAYIKGFYYRESDDLKPGLEYLERSLTLRKELGISHEIAASYDEMAIISFKKGELNNAKNYAEKVVTFAKQTKKKLYIANSLRRLTGTLKFFGDPDPIITLNKEALALYKDINNMLGMAHLLNNMGDDYRVLGDLDQALNCLEQSLALYNELGNLRYIAAVHDYLIQVLIKKMILRKLNNIFIS